MKTPVSLFLENLQEAAIKLGLALFGPNEPFGDLCKQNRSSLDTAELQHLIWVYPVSIMTVAAAFINIFSLFFGENKT